MERTSKELDRRSWESYFTQLTQRHPDLEVSIEIVGGEVGHGVEATALMLEDFVYDERSDVFEVAGSRRIGGSRQVLRHFVSHPRSIWVEDGVDVPSAIEVDHGDGLKTLVRTGRALALER